MSSTQVRGIKLFAVQVCGGPGTHDFEGCPRDWLRVHTYDTRSGFMSKWTLCKLDFMLGYFFRQLSSILRLLPQFDAQHMPVGGISVPRILKVKHRAPRAAFGVLWKP